jgi:hypothetical protein
MNGLFEIDRVLMVVAVIAALVWIVLNRDRPASLRDRPASLWDMDGDRAENLGTVVVRGERTRKPKGGA